MNIILAIAICYFGVQIECQTPQKTWERPRRDGAFDAFLPPSLPNVYNQLPANPNPSLDNPSHETQGLLTDMYKRNERMVTVLVKTQEHLAFGEADSSKKKAFTILTLFFLYYFDADTKNQETDLIEAFKETFKLTYKPANVIAGPIHTIIAKFISNVAIRTAYVSEICKTKHDCSSEVIQRDTIETQECGTYSANVRLHGAALESVTSQENILNFILEVTMQGKDVIPSTSHFDFEVFKRDLLHVKELYKLVKKTYNCYNIKSSTSVEASLQS